VGLDNYWVKDDKIYPIKFDPPLRVCGGVYSNSRCGSFRGKVYKELIFYLTQISLYKELSQLHIKKIAEILQKTSYDELPAGFRNVSSIFPRIKKKEYEDLRRMFVEYAKVDGIRLVPWY